MSQKESESADNDDDDDDDYEEVDEQNPDNVSCDILLTGIGAATTMTTTKADFYPSTVHRFFEMIRRRFVLQKI